MKAVLYYSKKHYLFSGCHKKLIFHSIFKEQEGYRCESVMLLMESHIYNPFKSNYKQMENMLYL